MPPEILEVLSLMDRASSVRQFARRHPDFGSITEVERLFSALAKANLLQEDAATDDWLWSPWMPEAAFFHFGTRGGRYPATLGEHDASLREKAVTDPPPPPTKVVAGPAVDLPAPHKIGTLSATLRERRTWRNFSPQPITISALANLLQLTWGVQKWGDVQGQGKVALKTSPSGGARHPVEAYVLALNVAGLPRRVFHYDAARHRLIDLQREISPDVLVKLLAGQTYFADAGAVIVMSAMFERSMWRYPSSRAYRVLLADTGHLAQTFCLLATAMKLAPFCTMAFDDRALDETLGIDGVTESSLYVVGVGTRADHAARRPGRIRKD